MNRPPQTEQRTTVLDLARQLAPKPLLIGAAAVSLGWWATLPETEALLETLVNEGLFRHASLAECRKAGIRFGYVLV